MLKSFFEQFKRVGWKKEKSKAERHTFTKERQIVATITRYGEELFVWDILTRGRKLIGIRKTIEDAKDLAEKTLKIGKHGRNN